MNISNLYAKLRSTSVLGTAKKVISQVQGLESWAQGLSDEELRQTFLSLTDLQSEKSVAQGFALVREAAKRSLGMRPFDVQLQGGWVLLQSKLAEMRTGEGKTLTLTVPASLLALERKGVHVVTANEYLARRDAELMRPLYESLGLSVGVIHGNQSLADKQAAYACDITYGVGSEFGFDYLKDHLVRSAAEKVQRGHFAAIVDEVDSILIDEARVPLIIAQASADTSEMMMVLNACVKGLTPDEHFTVNMKERSAQLTDAGYAVVEEALKAAGVIANLHELYDVKHLPWVRRLHSTVQAHAIFRKERDYVVEGNEIVLVDTGTGRKMPGRRLEEGLHEALEAREGLPVRPGTVVQATVTYQHYFGLYEKLAGLSGTALTDAEEFSELYQLETVVIPTNKPVIRKDNEDLVFLTKSEKFAAAVALADERRRKGQPVLLGCSSIRDAMVLDKMLTAAGIPHETLTAKVIEREAHIIANAGRPGAVTVATNVAGRGTDIHLGGERPEKNAFENEADFEAAYAQWAKAREAVCQAGGLFVLGTERNGLRRVDNQLAGRSGRQGDPGEVQFYLSLEDELLGVFGKSRQLQLLRKLIEAAKSALGGKTVAKLVTQSQMTVENKGFSDRKNLMSFDHVRAQQRDAVYTLRNALLEPETALEHLHASVEKAIEHWVAANVETFEDPQELPLAELKSTFQHQFGLVIPLLAWVNKDQLDVPTIAENMRTALKEHARKVITLTAEQAQMLCLVTLDEAWSSHLSELDELQKNVSFKTHTGFNPLFQFSKDAFELFKAFDMEVCHALMMACLTPESVPSTPAPKAVERSPEQKVALELEKRWVTRNEPCPCGSGKRYKDCHGHLA